MWTYEWPQSAETWHQTQQKQQKHVDGVALRNALAYVILLGQDGLLTEAEEQKLVAKLSGGDAALLTATAAYSTVADARGDARQRAARVLTRLAHN